MPEVESISRELKENRNKLSENERATIRISDCALGTLNGVQGTRRTLINDNRRAWVARLGYLLALSGSVQIGSDELTTRINPGTGA